MQNGDFIIHIDEPLDDDRIWDLERDLAAERGVLSACVHDRRRHLMLIDFDADATRPSDILQSVRSRGLHAEMIGL